MKESVKVLEAESEQTEDDLRRWGFMNRRVIAEGDNVYLDRLSLITTPWFSIKLHRIYRPDQQRDLHDHPWNFLSIVLRGEYIEDVPCRADCPLVSHRKGNHREVRHIRWFNLKKATDLHAISWVSRRPVWTLVLTGPRKRDWGFFVESLKRWVRWDKYDKLNTP